MAELVLLITLYCGVPNSCTVEMVTESPVVLKIHKLDASPQQLEILYVVCGEKTEIIDSVVTKSIKNCGISRTQP